MKILRILNALFLTAGFFSFLAACWSIEAAEQHALILTGFLCIFPGVMTIPVWIP